MASIQSARCLHAALLRPGTAGAFKTASGPLGAASVRHKSAAYGYTQAKALVFSKPGEPADVLRYALPRYPSQPLRHKPLT